MTTLHIVSYIYNMQGYYKRQLSSEVRNRLKNNPVTGILGPRQCGKSTLAKYLLGKIDKSIYLDLESPSDLRKLDDPETFFEINRDSLVCLDEIHRKPEIFPVLRSIVDRSGRNGQLLILGSASRDLIKQSSESLAGRISYLELTPFLSSEINKDNDPGTLRSFWIRGGYPRSYLSEKDEDSFIWRSDFISTYLERDIPQFGFNIPALAVRRLWQMCAHNHGRLLNSSRLGESLGVSHNTIRNYIDILEQTFMVRIVYPCETNLKKRLIKSPKVYIRDTGILNALLDIRTFNDLLGHPVYGPSWEGLVLEQVIGECPDWRPGFYRTSSGAEIDFILEKGSKRIAVECKVSSAPEVSKGFILSLKDLKISKAWIIAPVKESYPVRDNIMVGNLFEFIDTLKTV